MSGDHVDPGSRADKAKPNLLKNAKTQDLNPYLGTVIEGVQISQLSKAGLDELALYTAERKVLIFRDQDFKDIGPERQIEIARCVFHDRLYLRLVLNLVAGILVSSRDILPLAISKAILNFTLVSMNPSTLQHDSYVYAVYRDAKHNPFEGYLGNNSFQRVHWHSDIASLT